MAKNEKPDTTKASEFSEADKARARQWFKKAAECRERRDYDYAIECYIKGLEYWPEAVDEGHMPLRSVAVQRQQAGGKKPGLRDTMTRSVTGKDARKSMLNAEHLLAMDPGHVGFAEALLKNATKAGFLATCQWAAPIALDTLKREKKPNKARFTTFREALVDAAAQASARGNNVLETGLLEQAVQSLDFLSARLIGDEDVRNELRDLAGRLTIARGKYEQAEDFRESLLDADKQKLLHDSERVHQGEDTLEALIQATRREYEQSPETPAKINAYVDTLVKPERKKEEDVAIGILTKAHESSRNYSYKFRADDIRLRQLARQVEKLAARARKTGSPDDEQQHRLAAMELRQVSLETFRERVEKYPTDLRLRYKLGALLFEAGDYDEAIPALQAALQEPRSRTRCQLLLGQAFFEKGSPVQAVEVLREALEKYEGTDEFSKRLLYWLGRAYIAADRVEEAKDSLRRLVRLDYNYMDGDARRRLEELG